MRVAYVVLAFTFAFALEGCAEAPQGAPPSARHPVSPTVQGLTDLFERECLAGRDLSWARAESQRIVATCDGGLLGGGGEQGDCEQSVEGDVEWLVPTTDHRTVLVKLLWFDQPQRVWCSLSTGPDLAGPLGQVAQSAATAHSLPLQMKNDDKTAFGEAREAALIMESHPPERSVDPAPSFDTKGQWSGHFLAMERNHPNELEYRMPPDGHSRGQ